MHGQAMRRLAADLRSLHKKPLPPYYLFSPDQADQDDITQVDILLTGPPHTPFSAGLWKLHLSIPQDYPQSPPTANFYIPIFHPNVDPQTGSVCVEPLKRDWRSELTLRDILVTISCLLIQPNPDSALNAEAGALIQDDYELFVRRAKMMTSIHAGIPEHIRTAAHEAQFRGSIDASSSKGKESTPQAPARQRRIVDRRHGKIASRQSNGSPNEITRARNPSQSNGNHDIFMSSACSDNSLEDQENGMQPQCMTAVTPTLSAPRRPPGPPVPLGELIMEDASDDDFEPEYPPSPRKSPRKNPSTITRRLFAPESSRDAVKNAELSQPLFAGMSSLLATSESEMSGDDLEDTMRKRKHDTGMDIDEVQTFEERAPKRAAVSGEMLWKLCGQDVHRWNRCDFDSDPFGMVAPRW